MNRGPSPIPTEILTARGSTVPGRSRTREPRPKKVLGSPPKRLSKPEKAIWREIVSDLAEMKVGKQPDRRTIERYCVEFCLWWKAAEFVKQYGVSYPLKDDKGKVKCFIQWPQVAEMHKRGATLLKIEQEFGLTPASRARLHVESESGVTKVSSRPRMQVPVIAPEYAR